MNLRIAAKIGFLLVVIGFFMPVACDQNGLQLAKYFMDENTIIGILLYLLFISAIIGVILGILLLQNKEVSKGLEWFCLIVCISSGLIVYFTQLEGGPELQSGAYMILIGWILTFILQIIPDSNSSNTNKRSDYSSNKKCRNCGTIYSGSRTSCPKCSSSLYEEKNQGIDVNISSIPPINKNYGETWICKKCGEKNSITSTTCKSCGEYK